MNKYNRLKFLERLAQMAPPTDVPTQSVANTTPVTGTPPSFIASDYYPGMITAFQTKNIPIINGLADLLNKSLFYSSNGKIYLSWMRSVNFNFDTSGISSVDLRNLMMFTKQIYNNLFSNNGAKDEVQLTPEQIKERVNRLTMSQALENLSGTNPSGQLATKIGGNVKTLIKNYLLNIK